MLKRYFYCILLINFLSILPATVSIAQEVSLEYRVKAAFLVNFFKFLTWPTDLSNTSMSICILGSDPFSFEIDNLANVAKLDKKILVRRFRDASAIREGLRTQHCELLFSDMQLRTLSNEISNLPIVTVAENDNTVAISLLLIDGKVRFRVNQPLLEARGIKVSSKLMQLSVPSD